MAKLTQYNLKSTAEEKARWGRAAAQRRQPLSEWIRGILNREAALQADLLAFYEAQGASSPSTASRVSQINASLLRRS